MTIEDLHPGVRVALARDRMDEAQLARAMAAGELASPQQYGQSWYFNLRITGTGGSYREALNEFVWRDPSIYLNQEFLDRCNGLPVILEHPNKQMLDTREYHDRNIGSIVYPYIRGEEVWGIARILDAPSARYMREHDLSTSPSVVFLPRDGNRTVPLGGDQHLLIEGRPSLLDHLAICEEGVWDKGGPPAGVDVATQEKTMAMKDDDRRDDKRRADNEEEDKKEKEMKHEADRRADAERRADEKLDRLLEGIKVLSDRMDSYEEKEKEREDKRGDSEEEDKEKEEDREDKRRSDEDEMSEEEAKEDKRRADRHRDDKRDDKAKKDADPEHEAEQAAELHQLAEEEEEEAKEAAIEDRKDSARMPWDRAARNRGESDRAYATRADSIARESGAAHLAKRKDESLAAYCDRLADAHREYNARQDARRRLDSIDRIEGVLSKLISRVDSLTERQAPRTDEDEVKFADVQARADSAYAAFGDRAPRPLSGENLVGYRIRLARGLQKHSDAWREVDLGAIARSDSNGFKIAEAAIYADSLVAARKPTGLPAGTLREIRVKQPYGGEMIEFAGDPLVWMSAFMQPARAAKLTRNPGQHAPRA